jgi:hypothetical protein
MIAPFLDHFVETASRKKSGRDLRTPEIEVKVPQAGINVPYVAKAVVRFSSHLRAMRRASGGSGS